MGCSDLSDVYPSMWSLSRDFPGGPMVITLLPVQAVQVQALVRELRFPHAVQHGQRTKKKKKSISLFSESLWTMQCRQLDETLYSWDRFAFRIIHFSDYLQFILFCGCWKTCQNICLYKENFESLTHSHFLLNVTADQTVFSLTSCKPFWEWFPSIAWVQVKAVCLQCQPQGCLSRVSLIPVMSISFPLLARRLK